MQLNKTNVLILLASKNMNQQEFADSIEMSRGNFSALINGRSSTPKAAHRIAKALEVDVTEIIKKED